jgi:hypothetical protein
MGKADDNDDDSDEYGVPSTSASDDALVASDAARSYRKLHPASIDVIADV